MPKQTVFLVVQRAWYDLTMNPLITGTGSKSTGDAHVMYGAVKDLSDHRGLWFEKLTSEAITERDGTKLIMDVMVPWKYILCLGLVDERTPSPVGFTGATVLKSEGDESSH